MHPLPCFDALYSSTHRHSQHLIPLAPHPVIARSVRLLQAVPGSRSGRVGSASAGTPGCGEAAGQYFNRLLDRFAQSSRPSTVVWHGQGLARQLQGLAARQHARSCLRKPLGLLNSSQRGLQRVPRERHPRACSPAPVRACGCAAPAPQRICSTSAGRWPPHRYYRCAAACAAAQQLRRQCELRSTACR